MLHPQGATRSMNYEIIRQIAELEDGWISSLQISFELAPDDPDYRRQVRMTITSLARNHHIERLFATHRDQPLEIVRLDRDALLAILEAVAA